MTQPCFTTAWVLWSHASLAQAAPLCERRLADTDRQFYDRLVPAAKIRSLSARALLRALLQLQLGEAADRIQIAHHASGAPYLPDWPTVGINVSHSGEVVAAAVSGSGQLGIDIERVDPQFAMEPMVRHFFHRREATALAEIDPGARREVFFAFWAAKEAAVKSLHQGMAVRMCSFAVASPLRRGQAVGLDRPVHVMPLEGVSGYRAALAWPGNQGTVARVQQVDLHSLGGG